MSQPTSGTLTFLFSDVEGSTGLLRELGDGYPAVQARQQGLQRDAFVNHAGRVVDSPGDSFFVAFTRPGDAELLEPKSDAIRCLRVYFEGVLSTLETKSSNNLDSELRALRVLLRMYMRKHDLGDELA